MSAVASRTRVKVCGLTNAADRDLAVQAGADATGFIVDVPVDTPREVSPATAHDLVAGLPPFVTGVLVTMPETVEAAVDLQDRVDADAVQVHGSLDPSGVDRLRARLDVPVVAGVDAGDPAVDTYAGVADALLVDSTDEEGAGGTGETHDWEQTRTVVDRLDTPVVLAGGLTPKNVRLAADTVQPFAVDVASGVERTGGQKDHDAVVEFVGEATRTGVITGGG